MLLTVGDVALVETVVLGVLEDARYRESVPKLSRQSLMVCTCNEAVVLQMEL